jgi:aminoglycoside N3'-acetyltransferase
MRNSTLSRRIGHLPQPSRLSADFRRGKLPTTSLIVHGVDDNLNFNEHSHVAHSTDAS